MHHPFFSIVMPVYNGCSVITDALDSIASQTFKDYEVIVIDDGSTDKTVETLEEYCKTRNVSSPRLICHDHNRGIACARNTGIKAASADFIAFLDVDDIWHKDKLQGVYSVLSRDHTIDLVCHNEFYRKDGRIIREMRYNPHVSNLFDYLLFATNCISTSATVVRKSKLVEVGMFSEQYAMAEDYDLWLKLAKTSRVAFIDKTLGEFRIQPHGITSRLEEFTHYALAVIDSHFSQLVTKDSLLLQMKLRRRKASIYFESAVNAYMKEQWPMAIDYCLRCIRFYPFSLKIYAYLLLSYMKQTIAK